jgi:uncharacterized protein (TIGR03086 family)
LHRAALGVASSYVARIEPSQLHLPTPCAGWDLRQLLGHMVGQHLGFATVIARGEAAADAYRPVPFAPESWASSVQALIDAFAATDLGANVVEVELDPVRPLPVWVLVGAQWLDTVVHTWDIAAALGERYEPSADVAAAMHGMAVLIPDDERRDRAGAAFAHGVTVDGGSAWEQALALLGRDPDWCRDTASRSAPAHTA